MRDYDYFVRALTAVLSPVGAIEVDGSNGQAKVAFVTPLGRRLTFLASLDELYAAVEQTDGEVLSQPDDPSPLEGKLRLFSVHVEEAIDIANDTAQNLELRRYGVIAS